MSLVLFINTFILYTFLKRAKKYIFIFEKKMSICRYNCILVLFFYLLLFQKYNIQTFIKMQSNNLKNKL